MTARRVVAALTGGFTLALAGAPAWALCPNCLGQSPTVSPTLRLVGLFLLVPPAVFLVVAFAIRRALRRPR